MTESMIERVAITLEYMVTKRGFTSYEEAARAAIEAMREPTDAMIDSGDFEWSSSYPRSNATYRAMIDAALNEQVSG